MVAVGVLRDYPLVGDKVPEAVEDAYLRKVRTESVQVAVFKGFRRYDFTTYDQKPNGKRILAQPTMENRTNRTMIIFNYQGYVICVTTSEL